MHVLPQTRPRCFYDLVVQVAIIRPGPMTTKMHRRWILRRLGQEATDPVWPGLGLGAAAHAGAADFPGAGNAGRHGGGRIFGD